METIRHQRDEVERRIREACSRSGRNPRDVNIIAVTKYVDLERTGAALDAGLIHIGESRAQEAVPKWEALGDRGTWHFIGHLQRNKVKQVVGKFQYLHSLDRFSLAEEVNKRAEEAGKPLHCFIQVNVSGEGSKRGVSPEELTEFARETAQLPFIRIEGLMTMAPYTEDPEETRPVFRGLKRLQQQLRTLDNPRLDVPHLSMGMSRDYSIAVEEGATFLRLGSVLVGRQN
ncbi:YggS family pyridoxal phosphate-dependent enzyme [Desmospora profundinema]|uniref:Pyridoxal phosphate homeostasis protein n=1 Tax=Desmospora profundinema TaxID=1571184 RepID=A0ABU1ILX6_9BACL|nr:YggS family pyridoxal phosphate-dependent enzyme [Desmospora profundinema]MDR6224785.1 pyridoxal phosphate enzyme (YggS family) [Desmospora profundinema]